MIPTLQHFAEPADSAANLGGIACQPDASQLLIRPAQVVRQASSTRHLAISLGSSGAIQVLLVVGMAFVGGSAIGWTPRVIVLPPGASAIASAASAPVIEATVPADADLPESVALEAIPHDESAVFSPPPSPSSSSLVFVPISPNGSLPVRTSDVLPLEMRGEIRSPSVEPKLPEVRRPPLADLPPLRETPPIVERRRSHAAPTTQLARVPQPESRSSPPSQPSQGVESVDPPQKVFSPEPEYPAELLAARVEGLVLLRVRVAANGQVEAAAILRSSGREAFDNAALAAVRRWRFEPIRRAGAKGGMDLKVPIRFVIQDSPR